MINSKLKWYIVDKEYVEFLHKFDKVVENIDYSERLKPYIGILIEINEFNYYVPISSAKSKHYQMKENIDFIKIMKDEKIVGALNINNMIPILDENIKELKYKEIDKYRTFKNEKEKMRYIALLSLELDLINKKINKIRKSALKLYNEKINNPNSNIAKRCCDFKMLEEKAKIYNRFQ